MNMADIELVIKIPEEIYIHFLSRYKYQDTNDVGLSESEKVGVAVKNGIPLPKGHGALIDVDKIIGKIHGVKSITAVLDAKAIIEADKEESEE